MNIKKIVAVMLLFTMAFSMTAYAKTMQFDIDDNKAYVDEGEISEHSMDVKPYIVNGRTMVPARIIGETFGADVKWIAAERKVVITLDGKVVSMVIGHKNATVDGKQVEMDVPAVIKNDRTMVPLRFVSETLGLDVQYLAPTKQILITDDPAVFEFNGSKVSLAEFEALYKWNKLLYAQSGYTLTDADIVSLTSMQLMDYVVYDAESKKWGFEVESSIYPAIQADAQQFIPYFDDVLDASWIALLEKDYATSFLMNFLNLLYEPEKDVIDEYRNTTLKDYMAAKHILVSDEAVAKDLIKQIKNGADFDALMNQYSEDPGLQTSPNGYVFTSGQMVKSFEDATKALKVGQVSGIVESEHGYHIIRRIEISDEYVKSAYTEEKIAEHLNEVVDNGTAKLDAYTAEQLLELCK